MQDRRRDPVSGVLDTKPAYPEPAGKRRRQDGCCTQEQDIQGPAQSATRASRAQAQDAGRVPELQAEKVASPRVYGLRHLPWRAGHCGLRPGTARDPLDHCACLAAGSFPPKYWQEEEYDSSCTATGGIARAVAQALSQKGRPRQDPERRQEKALLCLQQRKTAPCTAKGKTA